MCVCVLFNYRYSFVFGYYFNIYIYMNIRPFFINFYRKKNVYKYKR